MIPVMQTRVGTTGNCYEACLATLLNLELSDIPDFPREWEDFLAAVQRFLLPLGMFYFQLKPDDPLVESIFADGLTFHFIEGTSPRGGRHACVAVNGELLHDPHPGGTGLVETDVYGFLGDRLI